jgi:histidinol-phosphatase
MPSELIQAALEAAEAADRLIRNAFGGVFSTRIKPDQSPVTEIDEAAEQAIRGILSQRFPDHGFYGEEFGRQSADADYVWLIDPIDGTKAFVRGYPVFSVQIGLLHRGKVIAGVSSAPCWNQGAGETLWAEQGQGSWRLQPGGPAVRLQVSAVETVEKTVLSTGNLARLAKSEAWLRFGDLIPRLWRIRGYGDFLQYHWLAAGAIDAAVESDVNILDISALSVIVSEAGGVMTDLTGAPIAIDTVSVLAAPPRLHAELLNILRYEPARLRPAP